MMEQKVELPNYYFFFVINICLFYRISLGFCGRFTCAELMSLFFSAMLVMVWIVTGHWVLMDGKKLFLAVFLYV